MPRGAPPSAGVWVKVPLKGSQSFRTTKSYLPSVRHFQGQDELYIVGRSKKHPGQNARRITSAEMNRFYSGEACYYGKTKSGNCRDRPGPSRGQLSWGPAGDCSWGVRVSGGPGKKGTCRNRRIGGVTRSTGNRGAGRKPRSYANEMEY